MKLVRRFAIALLLFLVVPAGARAAVVGTAFTYQGKLDRSGSPASGSHDLQFALYDAVSAGTQIGSTVTLSAVPVTNGVFTVTLDFGAGAFAGQARWLEISVKASADANYTLLTPRQPLTPAPYALYALGGAGGGGLTLPYAQGGSSTGAPLFAITNLAATGTPQALAGTSPAALGVGVSGSGGKYGVFGEGNTTGNGVWGQCNTPSAGAVVGYNYNTVGGSGVYGEAAGTNGVGISGKGGKWGVLGDGSTTGNGVFGQCNTPGAAAVFGYNYNSSGIGGYFSTVAGGVALQADGLAKVKTLQIMGGADLAERFDAPAGSEPGTVMAIDPATPGRLRVADAAYCRTVAGVVSGANGLDAGVELGRGEPGAGAVALALTGRVWVKCDATGGAIRAGDLLTTSDRAGYAMAVRDHDRAQGAILGKAMSSLEAGTGLVLALVSLQ